ncbi:hypothetical protein SAMN05444280_15710 [Tangfeifania diversioriginum]|uniref:Uncharacterized protein n=1 Tax=Tangfeifania diversioriginum TaxID=1168035 RepID=A0A1M6PD25_9BACT|nr:hypothetical protein [Tangfeifania diversioriginum]SHK05843.1 hypothetical protein SAMN05444280_15710 [Tangfeifania diversioriginum]
MNKKVKTITTWMAAAIFLLALAINIKVTLDDPFVMLSDEAIAQTTGTGGGTGDCCPDVWDWGLLRMVEDDDCIRRTESIVVVCSSTKIYRTYFEASGSIAGKAIVQGAIISLQSGVRTENYTDQSHSSSFSATRVNCPTDGDCKNCTEYDPCW